MAAHREGLQSFGGSFGGWVEDLADLLKAGWRVASSNC